MDAAHALAHAIVRGSRSGGRAAPHPTLLPVMDPRFNMREVAKQLLLLEDHLTQPRRRCNDCIRKHFAMAEALCEEAMTLGGGDAARSRSTAGAIRCAGELQEALRVLHSKLFHGRIGHSEAAQKLRAIRKPLLKESTEWFLKEKR